MGLRRRVFLFFPTIQNGQNADYQSPTSDRKLDYETRGRRFESCQPRQHQKNRNRGFMLMSETEQFEQSPIRATVRAEGRRSRPRQRSLTLVSERPRRGERPWARIILPAAPYTDKNRDRRGYQHCVLAPV